MSSFISRDDTKAKMAFMASISVSSESSSSNSSTKSERQISPRSIYMPTNIYASPSLDNERKNSFYESYGANEIRSLHGKYLSLANYSEWFLDYHRKRLPFSKKYLSDVKEILLQEVRNIETEVDTIETEQNTLLGIHDLLVNVRGELWESERNSQGLLIPEKLSDIIQRSVFDISNHEEVLITKLDIPFFDELCENVKKVKDTSTKLLKSISRLKIESVEDLFCRIGQLSGIVDTVLVLFYERVNKSSIPDHYSDDVVSTQASDDGDSAICVKCMESMHLTEVHNSTNSCNDVHHTVNHNGVVNRSTSFVSTSTPLGSNVDSTQIDNLKESKNYQDIISAMFKNYMKIKKHLKIVERMTSGRPKMKLLLKKFQEVSEMLEVQDMTCLEKYFIVFEENIHKFQKVLKTEKPSQCELDTARFLLCQLIGRTMILLKLEESNGQY